jgi:tRNA(adenine34) deaminase
MDIPRSLRDEGSVELTPASSRREAQMPKSLPRALTIDASRPSGNGGIQADLPVFAALGVQGVTAVTKVAEQPVQGHVMRHELEAALSERVEAARTGTMPTPEVARVVAEVLARKRLKLVVDPANTPFDAIAAAAEHLLPQAEIVHVRPEAAHVLTSVTIDGLDSQVAAGRVLLAAGASAALVRGAEGDHVDALVTADEVIELERAHVPPAHAHGAGAACSAACCAFLARGFGAVDAARAAHDYVQLTLHRGRRHAMQPWYDRSGLDPEPTVDLEASDEDDARFMARALELAAEAGAMGEVPIGAVVVCDGEIVGEGFNRRESAQDPLGHAEVLAIAQAARARERWRLTDATLYVTLEPCFMCAGAILNARIGRVVWGAPDPKAGAVISLARVLSDGRLNHRPTLRAGVREAECAETLREFFAALRPPG